MSAVRSMHVKFAGLLAVTAVWLAAPAIAGAQEIPPGLDYLETEPVNTYLQFDNAGGTGVPLGFLGTGCTGFQGTVHFGGEPLDPRSHGDTDTVVRRLTPGTPNPTAFVDIELVELSLRSMEPIAVQCNGSTQQWQVDVSLSGPQPQGQMQITETSTQGGTFGSTLPVIPKLTFTRLDDNAETRVIDGQDLPPSTLNNLIFFQNFGQYRKGCIPPALVMDGLNDLFCPGLTPDGQKTLTIEQAALARHGVYPAQPMLEHFKCYGLKKSKFKKRKVTLNDQFVNRTGKVTGRKELCNPAKKRKEAYENKRAHLTSYKTNGPAVNATVATLNQFGSQRLLVKKPQRLYVPSEKQKIGQKRKRVQTQIDHFQCYGVETLTKVRSVNGKPKKVKVKDQFRTEKLKLKDPKRLCAPVDKNGEGLLHPVWHLLCYAVKPRGHRTRVKIRNQFENKKLSVRSPKELCVPTVKQALSFG